MYVLLDLCDRHCQSNDCNAFVCIVGDNKGPGINDNGSGSSTNLELATSLYTSNVSFICKERTAVEETLEFRSFAFLFLSYRGMVYPIPFLLATDQDEVLR